MRAVRWLLIVAPLALLVVLAIYPGTGWLVRQHLGIQQGATAAQLSIALVAGDKETLARVQSGLKQVALKHPNDYLAQLGWAMSQTSEQVRFQELRALLPRFGKRPSLYAQILRYSTLSGVAIHRREETLIYGNLPVPPPLPLPPPPAEVLTEFDRIAREGERLDPDNAFFPMMRAVGYFAGGRDREAVQAILRASVKPRFDDYTHEEAQSKLHLYTLAYGQQPAIVQVSICFSLLFPHYAVIRSMTRMGQYMAMQADKAGRPQEAAAIRVALMRCGSLMRTQARSTIGNLVGMAVTAMGGSLPRPITAQPSRTPTREEIEQQRRKRETEFVQYLRRLGRENDARWAEREFQLAQETRELLAQRTMQDIFSDPVIGIAIASARAGAISATLLAMGLSALLLWVVWQPLSRLVNRLPEALFAMLIALFIVGVALWFLPAAVSSVVFVHSLSELTEQPNRPASSVVDALMNLLSSLAGGGSLTILQLFNVLALLVWLILLTAVITVVGVLCKQRATDALITGLRRHLPPVAGVLLVLYAVALIYNAQMERRWSSEIGKMLQHESAYRLQVMGKHL